MAEDRLDNPGEEKSQCQGRPRGGGRAASGGILRCPWSSAPPSPTSPSRGAFLSALPTPSCDLTLPLETLQGILSALTTSAIWQLTNLNRWLASLSWALCPIIAPRPFLPASPPNCWAPPFSCSTSRSNSTISVELLLHSVSQWSTSTPPSGQFSETEAQALSITLPCFSTTTSCHYAPALLKMQQWIPAILRMTYKLSLLKTTFLFISSTVLLTCSFLCFKQNFRRIPTSSVSLHTLGYKLSEGRETVPFVTILSLEWSPIYDTTPQSCVD